MAPPWLSPMPEHVPDPLRKLGWVQWRAELQPDREEPDPEGSEGVVPDRLPDAEGVVH